MTSHRDLTFLDDDIFAASLLYCLPEDMPAVSLTSDAEATLYQNVAAPFEFPAEHGYNLEAPSLASESTTQWTGIYSNLLLDSAGEDHAQLQAQAQGGVTNLASTSINTIKGYVPDPWTELQRAFLQFLIRNPHILWSLPDSTPCSIAQVKQAFEQNMHQDSFVFHSADLDRIIQQFKPQVSTTAIRHECDLKKKDMTSTGKFVCPFRFCDGHFTRGANLQTRAGKEETKSRRTNVNNQGSLNLDSNQFSIETSIVCPVNDSTSQQRCTMSENIDAVILIRTRTPAIPQHKFNVNVNDSTSLESFIIN
ncbi:hypothetical protein BDN70DRAFT_896478 [Pholiota conissans]|uniref:Uncharacterized protein n=1 Tax=Pholiota conissans TaxID=109636 RepID=A0A9P6CYH2_9AGAR|nr:hypothetical protein BDN70DRAFT_896478 [Pholiota conissans]